MSALVIGYGNTLRGDDAVGPATAHALAADRRFADVTVLSVHQLTPELADVVAHATRLVVVDAVVDGNPAGTVRVADVGLEPAATTFTHHVSASTILELAELLYGAAPLATVVTVSVLELEGDDRLTPPVAAAVPQVVEIVAGLLLEAIHA